jgi:poly-gamma-glutamate capsule biosynthesis protein CapA/YwtB (metallophosphatase superfamily)
VEIFIAGDALIQHRISTCSDDGFRALVQRMQSADLAIANLECCVQDGEDWPAFVGGGGRGATYMATPPESVGELQWMGIKAVFTANNHSQDFAEGGILTTLKYLDRSGMYHCGTGASLTRATTPAYVDTSHGRVAVIGAADWGPRGRADLPYPWPMGVLASDPDPFFRARPGVNLLRYEAVTHVDEESFENLRRVSAQLGWEDTKVMRNSGAGRSEPLVGTKVFDAEKEEDGELFFMGRKFVLDDGFTFETVPNEEDLERNYLAIQEARANADIVIVGLHQQGATRAHDEPPDHTRIFAHAAIDAGADLFAAHGHGRAGGIEIYKNKPVIYGLPGLINQISHVRAVPREQMLRFGLDPTRNPSGFIRSRANGENSAGGPEIDTRTTEFRPFVAHVVRFLPDNSFESVRMYPIEPIPAGVRSAEGLPRLLSVTSERAVRTLEVMGERMVQFGSAMKVEDGVGIVATN